MSARKDSLYLFILAALVVVGDFVLLALGRPIPGELWQAGALVVGGFIGVARQDTGGASTQTVTLPNAVAPQINGTTTTAAAASAAVEGLAQDVTG